MNLKKISEEFFLESIKKFDLLEKRTNYFTLAKNLIENNYFIEGHLLVLTTWNFARFRYVNKTFDIEAYRNNIISLEKDFNKLKDSDIIIINLNQFKANISNIYNTLSEIKGVEFTGATKIMHLINPNLFVIWDNYIRCGKPKIKYMKLKLFKEYYYNFIKYGNSSDGYIRFLQEMQNNFKHLKPKLLAKPMAKAIDEFNYVNITLEIQNEEDKLKKNVSTSKQVENKRR